MGYITQEKDYWIHSNALSITLNALGNANRTQCSVSGGAVIMAFIDGNATLGYNAAHGYKSWPISVSPTYFNSDTAKYVYVAIPRTETIGTQAVVVFPSEKLDIDGKNTDEAQVGSTDYLYIWLGAKISATDGTTPRTWESTILTGKLSTAQGDKEAMQQGDWYEWSTVAQTVTFLKKIVMSASSWFQNIRLGDDKKELTGVATASTPDTYIDSETLVVTPSYLEGKYLSKTHDDVAAGNITFLKGLLLGDGSHGITGEGAATLLDVIFQRILKSPGATDEMEGTGIYMDAEKGTIATDGLTVRGWMMIRKLIYNYLEIMEQDYQFSGGCDIEEVVDNEDGTYTLYIHKEKDGKHQDIATGDIMYGKVDENTGDGGYRYWTTWMKVLRVTQNEGTDAEGNLNRDTALVTLFSDNEVPGGRNFPPRSFMTAARRGNVADGYNPDNPDASEAEREAFAKSQLLRQSYWELSTTDHAINHYWRVNSPILRAENYATSWGIMPQKLVDEGVLPENAHRDGKPSLMAQDIYYEQLIPIKYPARIIYEDRGNWSPSPTEEYRGFNGGSYVPDGTITDGKQTYAAISNVPPSSDTQADHRIPEPYHFKTITRCTWLTARLDRTAYGSMSDADLRQQLYDYKKDLEVSRVYHRGALWEALVDEPTDEPWFTSRQWKHINGGTFALGFFTEGDDPTPIMGLAVRPANVDETVMPYLLFGQEDVTNIVTAWLWERESQYTALDEAWKNSMHTDPSDPTSPLKSQTRKLHITNDDLPTGWDTDGGKVGFKCTATFSLGGEQAEIINRISIV